MGPQRQPATAPRRGGTRNGGRGRGTGGPKDAVQAAATSGRGRSSSRGSSEWCAATAHAARSVTTWSGWCDQRQWCQWTSGYGHDPAAATTRCSGRWRCFPAADSGCRHEEPAGPGDNARAHEEGRFPAASASTGQQFPADSTATGRFGSRHGPSTTTTWVPGHSTRIGRSWRYSWSAGSRPGPRAAEPCTASQPRRQFAGRAEARRVHTAAIGCCVIKNLGFLLG